MRQSAKNRARAFSLLEVIVFIAIVSVAMLATLDAYIHYVRIDTVTEQRRVAMAAAEQKLDELRNFVNRVIQSDVYDIKTLSSGSPQKYAAGQNSLDALFEYYGPLPLATAYAPGYPGLPAQRPCTFNVPGLQPVPNSKGSGNAASGTVTLINSETPNACQFGYEYDGTNAPKIFCVNLYGDTYADPMNSANAGVFPSMAQGGVPPQAPFPMDLNDNGNTNDTNVTSGFAMMPVVITIRWVGPGMEVERLDVFAVLRPDSGKK